LADLSRHVAGLALPAAGLVAADAVRAAATSALVRSAAGEPVRFLRDAGATRIAIVAGNAVGVRRAARLARRGAADVGIAGGGDHCRAGTGAVARRGCRRHSSRATRPAALRRRVRAGSAVRTVAGTAAGRAVARAGRPPTLWCPAHGQALTDGTCDVARLALAVAGLVAANTVGAVCASALVRRAAGKAIRLFRDARARPIAVVGRRTIGIRGAARFASRRTAGIRAARGRHWPRARSGPVAARGSGGRSRRATCAPALGGRVRAGDVEAVAGTSAR